MGRIGTLDRLSQMIVDTTDAVLDIFKGDDDEQQQTHSSNAWHQNTDSRSDWGEIKRNANNGEPTLVRMSFVDPDHELSNNSFSAAVLFVYNDGEGIEFDAMVFGDHDPQYNQGKDKTVVRDLMDKQIHEYKTVPSGVSVDAVRKLMVLGRDNEGGVLKKTDKLFNDIMNLSTQSLHHNTPDELDLNPDILLSTEDLNQTDVNSQVLSEAVVQNVTANHGRG